MFKFKTAYPGHSRQSSLACGAEDTSTVFHPSSRLVLKLSSFALNLYNPHLVNLMSKGDSQKKDAYFEKVRTLFRAYKKVLIANVDNVTSTQMHQVRSALRGKAIILMGKNTMIRKAMRELLPENQKLEVLLPYIVGNIGLVFTNSDLKEVRDLLVSNRVSSGAKVGLIAQQDIYVPAGNTGIDPNKTSFFQALGISTKVVKGAIEIMTDVLIVKTGKKVGPSEAALLNMLNLSPFTFGLTVTDIYDNGSIYSPKMLDITDEVLGKLLKSAIDRVAAISLARGLPSLASAPHSLATAFKRAVALSLSDETSDELTFPAAEKVKSAIANAAKAGPVAASSAPQASASAAPAAAAAPAAKEESDEEMGFGLFD